MVNYRSLVFICFIHSSVYVSSNLSLSHPKSPLSDLQMVYLFTVSSQGRSEARELSGVSFIRALIPFMRTLPS